MQELYQIVLSRATPVRGEGLIIGQREKLRGFKSETSEDPMGSSGAGVVLQNCPLGVKGARLSHPSPSITDESLDMGGDWLWTRALS